jgi:hypothetical protein
MNFISASPSIVRSVKQRELLNVWLRSVVSMHSLPRVETFQPERLDDELADMMRFDVIGDGNLARFRITHEGTRLSAAYDTEDVAPADRINRFLDDAIGAMRYQRVHNSYHVCVSQRRPIYTVSTVYDSEGREVAYERLLLPFGNAEAVDQIVGSYKTISVDGRFQLRGLMGLNVSSVPQMTFMAVIDRSVAEGSALPESSDAIEID